MELGEENGVQMSLIYRETGEEQTTWTAGARRNDGG